MSEEGAIGRGFAILVFIIVGGCKLLKGKVECTRLEDRLIDCYKPNVIPNKALETFLLFIDLPVCTLDLIGGAYRIIPPVNDRFPPGTLYSTRACQGHIKPQ